MAQDFKISNNAFLTKQTSLCGVQSHSKVIKHKIRNIKGYKAFEVSLIFSVLALHVDVAALFAVICHDFVFQL